MNQHTRFLIVGGGISGLLTARELVLAGQDVTVLDKSRIGSESSWAGGGILLPIYPWRQAAAISELVANSLKKYPALARELCDATGIDPEWYRCGLLICKNPDVDAAIAWCQKYQVTLQQPTPEMLMPFDTVFEQPLWLPDIAQARNPRLLKALKAFLVQQGVRFVEHAHILRIQTAEHRVVAVETTHKTWSLDELVIATGAWTGEFLKQFFPDHADIVTIQPVRGQMLLFDAEPDTLHFMVLDGDHYLIPRHDGHILVGSTVEQVGFEKRVTQEAYARLYQFATRLLPVLQRYPVVAHWAGLRPGTLDGIPYIGRHPAFDNLSINAGHFRNGLVMGPAAAKLLADLLLGREPEIEPSAYALCS